MSQRIAHIRAKHRVGPRTAAALGGILLAGAVACGNAGPNGTEHIQSSSEAIQLTAIAVAASSHNTETGTQWDAINATDGDLTTRWDSAWHTENEWITLDLGSHQQWDEVQVNWDTHAFADIYAIMASDDNVNWTPVREFQDAHGCDSADGSCPIDGSVPEDRTNLFPHIPDPNNPGALLSGSRYVRLQLMQRDGSYGFSIREIRVYYNSSAQHLNANAAENLGKVSSAASTKSNKRGSAYHLCGWSVSGGQNDINAIKNNTAWTYNWSDHPGSCVSGSTDLANGTLEFVPMAWGVSSVGGKNFHIDNVDGNATDVSIAQMESDIPSNAKYLLGFNEPNFAAQSNLTPTVAAQHWADVEAVAANKGLQIVGPAVNYCSTTAGNSGTCVIDDKRTHGYLQPFAWLEAFYDECSSSGAAGHNCKIDYQAVHSYSWYGIWSVDPLRVKAGTKSSTKSHCSNHTKDIDEAGSDCGGEDCVACSTWAKSIFAKQAWLTEFAPTTDDCKASDCSANAQVTQAQSYISTFVDQNGKPSSFPSLEADPMVFRYAWFMPKISNITSLNADSLLTSSTTSPTATAVGNKYFSAAFSGGTCTPTTCAALGDNCGSVGDGCGGTLNCGSCTSPQTCGGGGTANHCGGGTCTPTTCSALGDNCGSVGDGCGGTLNCGVCAGHGVCTANKCGACMPTTCAALGDNCGSVSDGCSGTLNCGSCTSPQTCGGGGAANVCGGGASGPLSRTGWVGTGSPTGDPSSNAFDGNITTRWDTGTAQSGGETFTVDMQSNQTFSSLTLDANGGTNYAHGFKVDVSTNNSTWTNVYTTTSGSSLETATFPTQTARYIRITQTGTSGHWWSIYEMNVIH